MTTPSFDPNDLHEFYQTLEVLADEVIPATVNRYGDSKEVLAATLKLHRELLGKLRQADAMLETALIDTHIKFGGEQIEGVGTVIVHKAGKKTVYDNARLISVIASNLADRTMMADENGEIPPPAVATQIAVETMADLVGARAPSFSSWRKGAAKANKIDLDKFSEESGGRLSIRFES